MILKYCNVRVITPIEAGRCRKLDMDCLTDVYVFKPRCDSILTGKNSVENGCNAGHCSKFEQSLFRSTH